MKLLTSPKVIREILERHNFRFSKSLGQNFLIDRNIVEKIMEGAQVRGGDRIFEMRPWNWHPYPRAYIKRCKGCCCRD